MTESESATKRQLWYLHILTKTDTRELQITKAEASRQIQFARARILLKNEIAPKPELGQKPTEPTPEIVSVPPVESLPIQRKCPKCNLPMYHGIQSSVFGSTFECCPDCAAPLVKELERASEFTGSKPIMDGAKSYHGAGFGSLTQVISPEHHLWLSGHYTKYPDGILPEQDIEITCDTEPIISLNGNYSKGVIKETMSHYCKPGEGKIRLVKVK